MTNDSGLPLSPAEPTTTIVRGRRRHLPGLAQWLAGGLALGVLATVSIPAWSQTAGKGARVKSLAQAKQIGLALKLFASDNDGVYPQDGTPTNLKKPTTSNAAFAPLFPLYLSSESVFGDNASAYQTHAPDNVIDKEYTGKPVKTLEPGENVFSYLMGLTDASDAHCPLVMDGTDGTGHYTADATRLGGIGADGVVIVIRVDCSGVLERLAGPATALYVPLGKELATATGGKPDDNLLDAKLYGKDARLLEPGGRSDDHETTVRKAPQAHPNQGRDDSPSRSLFWIG